MKIERTKNATRNVAVGGNTAIIPDDWAFCFKNCYDTYSWNAVCRSE